MPNTVGAISTPLVIFVGTARITCSTSGRESLSNTISSPRRGVTVNPSCPSMRSSSSERRPAALTRKRVVQERPPDEDTRRPPPSSRSTSSTGVLRRSSQTRLHRLGGEGQRGGEGTDDALVGHLERAHRAGPEIGLAPIELLHTELPDRLVAVGPRTLDDPRKLGELLVVPGHQQGTRALERDPHALRVLAEQLVAARHQGRLERARLGVEAGVEQGGVGLAGAGAHVGPRLEQGDAEVEAGELARDRAAHHAGPRYQDVRVEPALHIRSIAPSVSAPPPTASCAVAPAAARTRCDPVPAPQPAPRTGPAGDTPCRRQGAFPPRGRRRPPRRYTGVLPPYAV